MSIALADCPVWSGSVRITNEVQTLCGLLGDGDRLIAIVFIGAFEVVWHEPLNDV